MYSTNWRKDCLRSGRRLTVRDKVTTIPRRREGPVASTNDSETEGLRKALDASPDNDVLRQLLADSLAAKGRLEEAEAECRTILGRNPDSYEAQLGLARIFALHFREGEAIVLLEELLDSRPGDGDATLLYVKMLARDGQVGKAVGLYKDLVRDHPRLGDEEFEEAYGVVREIPAPATSAVVDGRVRTGEEEGGPLEVQTPERPLIAFRDVGGMEHLKEEIRMKVIAPMQNADLFRAYGKSVGGGILMYGPPGCGKTHIARATAGESEAAYIPVGIHEVLDMWIGSSERNLHALFEQGRRNTPCVLFFDEVDALGASRADMRRSGGRHLINQFLSELDGVKSSNEGLVILAATNAPWHLDSAFRRPGRFDRIIFVPPPDGSARGEILKVHLKGKPVGVVDYGAVAAKTAGFSGADMKALVDRAAEEKLKEAMAKGRTVELTGKDLLRAAKKVKATTKEWLTSARNHALYANESGMYDEILDYLKMK